MIELANYLVIPELKHRLIEVAMKLAHSSKIATDIRHVIVENGYGSPLQQKKFEWLYSAKQLYLRK